MVEGANHCVQCLADGDCAAPFVCATDLRTCVECTPTNSSACRADVAGGRCLAGGACGCATDADCGASTSGRVCDASLARCVPGCRGNGGNTCPTSLTCTSTTADIGHCQSMTGTAGASGNPGTGGTRATGAGGTSGASGTTGAAGTTGTTGASGTTGTTGIGGTGADTGGAGTTATGSGAATGASGSGGGANTGTGGATGSGANTGTGGDPTGTAGSGPDAGTTGAGATGGASPLDPGGFVAGGGCRCDLPGTSTPATALLAAFALALARLIRRPRRRR